MIKLIVYQKNNSKPILITDNKSTLEEAKEQCTKLFSSKKIYRIETFTDCLIGRPSEIQSILITTDNINEIPIDDKKKTVELLQEGQLKKGGVNAKPSTPKQEIKPPSQKPTPVVEKSAEEPVKSEKIVMTLEELKKKQENQKRENEKELQDMVSKYKDDVEVKL